MERSSRWRQTLFGFNATNCTNALVVRRRDAHQLFGWQRSICTGHALGTDKAPEVLRCLVRKAVQVVNLAYVVVDVAHRGCPVVGGFGRPS